MGVSGIIMASGLAQRFGRNKLLEEFKGKPVYMHILETLLKTGLEECIVVSCYKNILSAASELGYITVYNPDYMQGQSASIRLGISVANIGNNYAFFTGDQPLITEYTINAMLELSKANPQSIVVPKYKQKMASPCIFANSFQKELLAILGDTGGKQIINNNPRRVIYFLIERELEIFDIDTIADLHYLSNNF